jgi:trans-aconitate 2-methyltransferase
MPWNPSTYQKFQAERAAPFEDLVRLINKVEGLRVIDLGCGTGELTARLADTLPGSDVLGIDNSPEMLERAAPLTRPGLRFEQRTIEEVIGDASMQGAWDVVFSHAAIHWVDEHEALIPALVGLVAHGGQIAVQMPSNHTHVTHRTIAELAREEPFRAALGGWVRQVPVLGIEAYAKLLYDCGAEQITVFEKIYPHILEHADAVADWTSGTALVPYFERLSPDMKAAFDAEYRARLRAALPHSPVFYGFRRILFAATLSDS